MCELCFPSPKARPEAFYPISLWDLHLRVRMDVKEEVLDILQKVWTKVQGLPQATPLEVGAFSVLVLFVGKYLLVIGWDTDTFSDVQTT